MHIRYTFKNIQDSHHEEIKRKIQNICDRDIEPLLKRTAAYRVRLAAKIELLSSKKLFSVALRLHVPKKVLVSREENKDIDSAIGEAFADLKSQLAKYNSRVRREDSWKRKYRRDQLRRLKAVTESAKEHDRQSYFDLISSHLPKLQRVVRHELTYMRAKGDLPPDYPSIEDIVDETLARAYKLFNDRPASLSVDTWLIQIAIDVIAEEVVRFRIQEGMDSLEKSVSPLELIPEDEIFEFWQPDEMLTIEDLVASSQAQTPNEPVEIKESRIFLYKLLGLLPVKWRRAVNLLVLEGYTKSQVAESLGTDEGTVEQWIKNAEAFLHERMQEAGYQIPQSGSYFEYLIPLKAPDEYREQVEQELRKTLGL